MAQSTPRPRAPVERPNYPRLSALAIATALAACGGEVEGSGESGQSASDDVTSSESGGAGSVPAKSSADPKGRGGGNWAGGIPSSYSDAAGGSASDEPSTASTTEVAARSTGGSAAKASAGGASDQPSTVSTLAVGGADTAAPASIARGSSANLSAGGSSIPQLGGGAPLAYTPTAGATGASAAGAPSSSIPQLGGGAGGSSATSSSTAQGSTGGGTSAPSFVASGGRSD